MHESCRKRHNYLGMWLDYLVPGKLWISMEEYLRGVHDDLPEEITEFTETPAATNLFTIRKKTEQEPHNKTRVHAFHYAVAHLPFTSIH